MGGGGGRYIGEQLGSKLDSAWLGSVSGSARRGSDRLGAGLAWLGLSQS